MGLTGGTGTGGSEEEADLEKCIGEAEQDWTNKIPLRIAFSRYSRFADIIYRYPEKAERAADLMQKYSKNFSHDEEEAIMSLISIKHTEEANQTANDILREIQSLTP